MAVLRFDQVIGHAEAIERLRRDLLGDRLAHAYLFVGPEGIGKAAVARLFGAGTLCKSPDKSSRPCGECIACGKIDRHNHSDFHTLAPEEGKRWIRIDQVRELQSSMMIRPIESDRRVVIIDGAECMNEAAQNAFLKTLEEPPPGTLIVLVAPGLHQLLPTIVSRCRIEQFGPLSNTELAGILTEKRGLDENEAILIAGLAYGSVGAALSMDIEFVRRARPALFSRIAGIASGDITNPENIFGFANQLTSIGEESLVMIRALLRDVAHKKLNRGNITNSDQGEIIDLLANKWSMDEIIRLFEKTIEAEKGIARNLQKSLVYENLLFCFAQGEN